MAYWNDSATSGYVNYLGTNDRTIRPPTPAEQALAAQQAKDAADRKAAADAAAAAQRERLRQEQVAAQQRRDDLAAQQAAEARQRQYALQDARTKREQELADRAAAQARADALMNQFGFGGGAGGDGGGAGAGGGGSMAALSTIAGGGGGGAVPAGGGGAALMTLPDTTAADSAARTQAKEKAALRLQSSMRGLDTAMSGRGIRGSGLHSQGMADLFGQSASDEATSEMDRLNDRANKEFQVGGRNQDAMNQLNIANMQAQQWAQERADKLANEQRQLALTLAQFGMKY